jgi:hypothetical protein
MAMFQRSTLSLALAWTGASRTQQESAVAIAADAQCDLRRVFIEILRFDSLPRDAARTRRYRAGARQIMRKS